MSIPCASAVEVNEIIGKMIDAKTAKTKPRKVKMADKYFDCYRIFEAKIGDLLKEKYCGL